MGKRLTMKKLYEDVAIKTKHYIECVGDKSLLIDKGVIVRILKEEKEFKK